MTAEELLLLKQWITCEELRLADDVRCASAQLAAHPTELSAIRAAQAIGAYTSFRSFARKLDALLHVFP